MIEEEEIAKAGAESSGSSYRCESCGGPTQDKLVDVTMWTAKQLVLIENVPAHICENCQSQYYDQDVGMKMQDLISKGFPKSQQIREIAVPVFTLDGIKVGRLPEDPG